MKRKLLLALTLAATLLPTAMRAAETNHWYFDSAFNVFLAGMTGDVAVKGQSAAVDSSFTDVAKTLDFALAGRVTAVYDRWSLSTEFSYLKLGVSGAAARVELEQWLVEPSVG